MVRLEAPKPPMTSGSSPISKAKYETTNRTVQIADSPNMVATWRSARRSAFGSTSVGRQWCSGSPGFGVQVVGLRRVGEVRQLVTGLVRQVVVAHASAFFLVDRVVWAAIQTAAPTQSADADQPGGQALGDGAEAAEAEAAVVRLLLERGRGSAITSRFASGVRLPLLNVGIACGPVSRAS